MASWNFELSVQSIWETSSADVLIVKAVIVIGHPGLWTHENEADLRRDCYSKESGRTVGSTSTLIRGTQHFQGKSFYFHIGRSHTVSENVRR